MDILSAVIAGIIQGATEFLPVSSSGHLALFHAFFGQNDFYDQVAFDVFLHLGTLIAVCAVYRKDVIGLIKGCFTGVYKLISGKYRCGYTEYERLAFFVAFATLPLVLLALTGADGAVDVVSLHPVIVGAALITNGFVLLLTEKSGAGGRGLSEMRPRHALMIGLCQAAAIIPGLSRSGCTVCGGSVQRFDRDSAVKFSFLISVPAIAGANVLKLPDVIGSGEFTGNTAVYICGFAAAAISGFCAVKLFLLAVRKAKLRCFSFYCFALGAAAVIYEIITVI